MDDNLQVAPFRSIDDFIWSSARFGMPEKQTKERWNNRIIQNLLYYQTNYLLVALVAFFLVTFFRPVETLMGGLLVGAMFIGFHFASQNRGTTQRFKQDHPVMSVFLILAGSFLIMYLCGSIAAFLFSIAFPMLIVLLHASLRMRNIKNKIQNKVEAVGLKTTPMGVILKALDQEVTLSQF